MADIQKQYLENWLIPQIITKLPNEELVSFETEKFIGIDGFMSTLYNIKLSTKTKEGEKQRLFIAKFMRGDANFRETSKCYILFANEIYIYGTVLPAFDTMLKECKISSLKVTDWVPLNFKAEFGYIDGLSSCLAEKEAALVLENLKPLGYQLGPRLALNLNQLLAMCKPLAQYHACSYALKVLNDPQFQRLKSGIITLPFINDTDPNDAKNNTYRIIYRLAFDRFYEFYDRKINTNTFDRTSRKDLHLIECLRKLRENYFADPARLMERLRINVEDNEEDSKFAAILHGDYNRNNVLFKYKLQQGDGGETVVDDIKMIDFQELRYGSPALDLSFFMFFNSSEAIRSNNWLDLLKSYHSTMLSTLSTILNGSAKAAKEVEEILQHYTFEKFQAHFSRFAFYGAMICIKFLPWMLCSEEECSRISELFATDMCGEEFRKLCIEAGGDEVNYRILSVLRHASDMGYMNEL